MDLSDKDHRAYIRRIYNSHRGGLSKDFERFYESQSLWDEGMAETLSEFLKSSESQDKTILVIAGNGHIVFDFGIPKRFYRRTPFPFKTLVMKEWTKEADQDLVSPRLLPRLPISSGSRDRIHRSKRGPGSVSS